MNPAIATLVTTFPFIPWATQRLSDKIQVKRTQNLELLGLHTKKLIKYLPVSAARLPWGGGRCPSAESLSSFTQLQHEHQRVEHPKEQHWQRPLQSENARAFQRAAQHPAEDVRGAGVLWAAVQSCQHGGPFPMHGEVRWRSRWSLKLVFRSGPE